MTAFSDALRSELAEALCESEGALALAPHDTSELEAAFALARAHDGRLRAPGGDARDGDVAINLRFMNHLHSVDEMSRIAHVDAGMGVAELEAGLRPEGLSLGCRACSAGEALGRWIARGAPGRRPPADDPVDQVICGAEVMLADGRLLEIRPAPRRAVGPDLLGVLLGGRGRLGVLLGLHLVLGARGERTKKTYLFPSLAQAEVASAWARGRGMRAARLATGPCAEGGALWAEVARDEMEESRLKLLHDVCAQHAGRALAEADAPPWPEVVCTPPPPSPILDALAARLDPEHILS